MTIKIASSLLLLIAFGSATASAQATVSPAPTAAAPAKPAMPPADLPITANSYVQYPSLSPVSAVSISIGTAGTSIYDIIHKEAANPNWNCGSPEFYKVAVVKASADKSLTIQRQLNVRAVRLIGNGLNGARYTSCYDNQPGVVDLVLGSMVNKGELIQVFVYEDAKQTNLLITSDGTLSFSAGSFPSFTVTPQAAPGEALNNGTARTVGQLSVAFSDANLIPTWPLNLYAKTTDLISTIGQDSKSAVSVTGGIQRGLFSTWYSPWHFEETLQGNQTAQNLSTVTSLGLAADPHWLETKSLLNNGFISAPLPPEPSITAQYTHRFNQLVTKKTPLLAVNDFSLNPSMSWSSINFPFTCHLLFWEPKPQKTKAVVGAPTQTAAQAASAKAAASPQTPTCLGTELNLGLWYLPLDLTSHGSRKAEGYGDISILIPLSDFSVASKELTFISGTGTDPTKFQIRIKYADTVNAANNYARTKQWTFGIEALK